MIHSRSVPQYRRVGSLVAVCSVGVALALSTNADSHRGLTAPEPAALFPTGLRHRGLRPYVDTIQWLRWGDYETQFKGQASRYCRARL